MLPQHIVYYCEGFVRSGQTKLAELIALIRKARSQRVAVLLTMWKPLFGHDDRRSDRASDRCEVLRQPPLARRRAPRVSSTSGLANELSSRISYQRES